MISTSPGSTITVGSSGIPRTGSGTGAAKFPDGQEWRQITAFPEFRVHCVLESPAEVRR
jgi:hypothetical protein